MSPSLPIWDELPMQILHCQLCATDSVIKLSSTRDKSFHTLNSNTFMLPNEFCGAACYVGKQISILCRKVMGRAFKAHVVVRSLCMFLMEKEMDAL